MKNQKQPSLNRERIVGFSLAPLQRSERAMLKGILERLDKEVCSIKKMIKVFIIAERSARYHFWRLLDKFRRAQ